MLEKFINSWYFVAIILGLFFLYLTRKSWNKLIDEAAINIKTKFFKLNRNKEEQSLVGESDKFEKAEYKKVKKLFQDLNIDNFDQFNQLLTNFAQGSEANRQKAEEAESRIKNMFDLWRFYMFSFLNLFLVPRSKLALIWLLNNPNSTKDMLLLNTIIPPEIENKALEKEAVFNALISHSLMEKDERDLYKVTDIGNDFLKFAGLVN